ncbi:MAG: hypothetical protein V7742_00285 [Halioglobus sp.]
MGELSVDYSLLDEEEGSEHERTEEKGRLGIASLEEALRATEQQRQYLDEVFSQEPVDYVWASDATLKLGEVFQSPALDKLEISDVDCRSTLCRVDIFFDEISFAEEADYDNHMLMELTSAFRGGVNMRRARNSDGSLSMVAYTVKDGHEIPTYQSAGAIGQ